MPIRVLSPPLPKVLPQIPLTAAWDAQVACNTDLTNQNQKDTLVQAGDVWKDAFIVDDRGDRHQRSSGFFLNVDGDQPS